MPTRRQLIQKITLNASTTSVTFSNIPQNYTDLKIVGSARGTTNPFSEAWFFGTLGINNDGNGVNQSGRHLIGGGASTTAESFSAATRYYFTSSGATANTYGTFEIYFPNYTGSSTKSIRVSSAGENNASPNIVHSGAGLWSGTSPINQLVLFPRQDSFASGSTFYLYGITHVPIIRGGEVSIAGGYKYHIFRSSGPLQVVEPGDVEYLVVSGGGGGAIRGNRGGGGGGAGGVLIGRTRMNAGIQSAVIGAGGTGSTYIISSVDGQDGSSSSISTVTSVGGGGGGGATGRIGGSGGGAGGNEGASGGSGTTGQGNSGGAGASGNPVAAGGGGGGAGQSGAAGSGSTGGKGGDGISTSLIGGGAVTIGAGGGGGGDTVAGLGGSGGGGAGGGSDSGFNAISNTGSGGGGCGDAGSNTTSGIKGGNGGSGIVAIRYPYDGN